MTTPVAVPPAERSAVELIEFIVRDAVFMADVTCQYPRATRAAALAGGATRESGRLAREFLLELAAVLRLDLWERSGVRDRLDPGLPPAEQALADLFAPGGHGGLPIGAPVTLAMSVFRASLRHLAWGGREELGADVVLDEPDDEVLLEALADLLWEHRHLGRGGG